MNVKCMIDIKTFKQKPTAQETGGIQKRLSQMEINIKELANLLSSGATFKPALLNGTKNTDWINQQLFALDFDEGTNIEEQLNKCNELKVYPAFGYTSFSYTEEKQKFRLVFVTDEIITDINTRNTLQIILIHTFDKSDEVTKDATRLFYGGKFLFTDKFNTINAQDIINRFYKEEYQAEINELNAKMIGKKVVKPSKIETKDKKNVKENKLISKSTGVNLNVEAIKNLDVDTLQQLVCIEGIGGGMINNILIYQSTSNQTYEPQGIDVNFIAKNREEVFEFIDNIDLADFLGIDNPKSFQCIIHKDEHPSAGIIKSLDGKETDIYNCLSSNCRFSGGIIQVVEKLARCNKSTAINFIKEVYGIKLIQSEWQKEQIELLELNKYYLLSGKMEYVHPELWKLIKPRLSKLNSFLDLAINNIYDEELSYNDLPVFWVSNSYLKTIFDTNSMETVNKTITLFALLNIISKLPEENIPEKMLTKAKSEMAKKGFKKLPNHYQIPSYDVNTLEKSEEHAKILFDNNFSMKGISREWVLRTFGEEVANIVYPQYYKENKKGTTKNSDERTRYIIEAIFSILGNKQYVIETDIINYITEIAKENKKVFNLFHSKDRYGVKRFSPDKVKVQIKKSLQEVLDNYNLKRFKCTKEDKEKLRITSKGYPFIIVRGGELNE